MVGSYSPAVARAAARALASAPNSSSLTATGRPARAFSLDSSLSSRKRLRACSQCSNRRATSAPARSAAGTAATTETSAPMARNATRRIPSGSGSSAGNGSGGTGPPERGRLRAAVAEPVAAVLAAAEEAVVRPLARRHLPPAVAGGIVHRGRAGGAGRSARSRGADESQQRAEPEDRGDGDPSLPAVHALERLVPRAAPPRAGPRRDHRALARRAGRSPGVHHHLRQHVPRPSHHRAGRTFEISQ